jgi:hypothetical protein
MPQNGHYSGPFRDQANIKKSAGHPALVPARWGSKAERQSRDCLPEPGAFSMDAQKAPLALSALFLPPLR